MVGACTVVGAGRRRRAASEVRSGCGRRHCRLRRVRSGHYRWQFSLTPAIFVRVRLKQMSHRTQAPCGSSLVRLDRPPGPSGRRAAADRAGGPRPVRRQRLRGDDDRRHRRGRRRLGAHGVRRVGTKASAAQGVHRRRARRRRREQSPVVDRPPGEWVYDTDDPRELLGRYAVMMGELAAGRRRSTTSLVRAADADPELADAARRLRAPAAPGRRPSSPRPSPAAAASRRPYRRRGPRHRLGLQRPRAVRDAHLQAPMVEPPLRRMGAQHARPARRRTTHHRLRATPLSASTQHVITASWRQPCLPCGPQPCAAPSCRLGWPFLTLNATDVRRLVPASDLC